jgi:hypothetical protein
VSSGRYADAITPAPAAPMIHGRQVKTAFSTCGYLSGDPALSWVAGQGFNCRINTAHGVWGFCPTSVIAASDCGLGGFCFDAGPCSVGCGRASLKDNPKVTTWTWYVCITAWLGLPVLTCIQPRGRRQDQRQVLLDSHTHRRPRPDILLHRLRNRARKGDLLCVAYRCPRSPFHQSDIVNRRGCRVPQPRRWFIGQSWSPSNTYFLIATIIRNSWSNNRSLRCNWGPRFAPWGCVKKMQRRARGPQAT